MEEQIMTPKDERAEKKAMQSAADKKAAFKKKFAGMGKYLVGIAAVVFVIGGLVVLAEGQEKVSQTSPLTNTITATDHVAGNPEAKVTVIEYSDFQCPACRMYAPIVTQLIEEYGDRVQFVYRHFPIYSKHLNAEAAGRASEAAAKQGKFWEYGEVLFTKQDEWASLGNPTDTFIGYAQELGLNVDTFKADYNDKVSKAEVTADYKSGLQGRVNGTPSFFVNGQLITSPGGYAPFAALLDEKLGAEISN